MDGRRLRLRSAYLSTVAVIEESNRALWTAETELRAALEPYGEADEDFPARPADQPGIPARVG